VRFSFRFSFLGILRAAPFKALAYAPFARLTARALSAKLTRFARFVSESGYIFLSRLKPLLRGGKLGLQGFDEVCGVMV
jgi:hypothetical protein